MTQVQASDSFLAKVQSIEALALFARALPAWCRRSGHEVSITIKSNADHIAINLGLSPGATEDDAESAIEFLEKTQRLVSLQTLVDEFRNVGVDQDTLDAMIDEAEGLAVELFPPSEAGQAAGPG